MSFYYLYDHKRINKYNNNIKTPSDSSVTKQVRMVKKYIIERHKLESVCVCVV